MQFLHFSKNSKPLFDVFVAGFQLFLVALFLLTLKNTVSTAVGKPNIPHQLRLAPSRLCFLQNINSNIMPISVTLPSIKNYLIAFKERYPHIFAVKLGEAYRKLW
jgi:hypothetical protein